jgi:D-alanine transaminase
VRNGTLITPPNSTQLLPGTSRSVVEELADNLGVARRDAQVTEAELRSADEIWLAAATREVQPVTVLDAAQVGSGKPGPVWRKIYDGWQQLKRAVQS